MPFPHPQSGEDHYRDDDKASKRSVVRDLVKRTIDVAEYWDAKDDVNPAKNRSFGIGAHDGDDG